MQLVFSGVSRVICSTNNRRNSLIVRCRHDAIPEQTQSNIQQLFIGRHLCVGCTARAQKQCVFDREGTSFVCGS